MHGKWRRTTPAAITRVLNLTSISGRFRVIYTESRSFCMSASLKPAGTASRRAESKHGGGVFSTAGGECDGGRGLQRREAADGRVLEQLAAHRAQFLVHLQHPRTPRRPHTAPSTVVDGEGDDAAI